MGGRILYTKVGHDAGLGEKESEVLTAMHDLRLAGL